VWASKRETKAELSTLDWKERSVRSYKEGATSREDKRYGPEKSSLYSPFLRKTPRLLLLLDDLSLWWMLSVCESVFSSNSTLTIITTLTLDPYLTGNLSQF
jgi:hypothetical protein